MRKLFMASVMVALAGQAAAGSFTPLPAERPVTPPAAFNWGGAYVGVQAGIFDGRFRLTGENLNNNNTMASSLNPDGHTFGIFAGYNWHSGGPYVFGVEAEYNRVNADIVGPGVPPPSFGFLRGSVSASMSNNAALRLRMGYAMDRTLFYGTVGAAQASVAVSGTSTGGAVEFADSGRVNGFTLGVGVEHAVNANWTVRADFRHTNYRNRAIDFVSPGMGTPHLFNLRVRTNELRLGAAYRF